MLCEPPEFTVTVNDVAFDGAQRDVVSMFDIRPACAEAFAAKIASVAIDDGESAKSNHSGVPGRG